MNELNLGECKKQLKRIESYRFQPLLLDKEGYNYINETSQKRVEKVRNLLENYSDTIQRFKDEASETARELEAQYVKTVKKNRDWFFTSGKGKQRHAEALRIASKEYQSQVDANNKQLESKISSLNQKIIDTISQCDSKELSDQKTVQAASLRRIADRQQRIESLSKHSVLYLVSHDSISHSELSCGDILLHPIYRGDGQLELFLRDNLYFLLTHDEKDWDILDEDERIEFLLSCTQETIENTRTEAYEQGYDDGYSEGYEKGHDEGHEEGYKKGYDEGYDDGYNSGYSSGHHDGVNESQ